MNSHYLQFLHCLRCFMHDSATAGTGLSLTLASYISSFNSDPIYFWQQTLEDITVSVRMPEGITKEEVQFRLTADNMSIGVQGFPPLLQGQLYASVDPEASAWIIKNHKRFASWNVYCSLNSGFSGAETALDTRNLTVLYYCSISQIKTSFRMRSVLRHPQNIDSKEQFPSIFFFVYFTVCSLSADLESQKMGVVPHIEMKIYLLYTTFMHHSRDFSDMRHNMNLFVYTFYILWYML